MKGGLMVSRPPQSRRGRHLLVTNFDTNSVVRVSPDGATRTTFAAGIPNPVFITHIPEPAGCALLALCAGTLWRPAGEHADRDRPLRPANNNDSRRDHAGPERCRRRPGPRTDPLLLSG